MNFSCGIDFGTSNTVFTLINSTGKVVDSLTIPTIFFIYSEVQGISKVKIGQDAIASFLNSGEGRIIHSIKKSFANPHYRSTRINNVLLSVEELLALFIEKFREFLLDRYTFIPPRIVLGRPVSFSENPENHQLALNRLEQGFRLGGFDDFEFLEEPIGAYLSLKDRLKPSARHILVCDFGGGTSDFTLLRQQPGEGITLLGKRGIDLGGNEYDELVITKMIPHHFGKGVSYKSFGKWLPFPEHHIYDVADWNNVFYLNRSKAVEEIKEFRGGLDRRKPVDRLLKVLDKKRNYLTLTQAQENKHTLQESRESTFSFACLDEDHGVPLFQEEYRECCHPIDERILRCARELTGEFLDRPEELDTLVFTGGSSKLANLKNVFGEGYPAAEILFDENFFNSISHGLALYAHDANLLR